MNSSSALPSSLSKPTSGVSSDEPIQPISTTSTSRPRKASKQPSLPLRSPNSFLLFRMHLIATARESGMTVQREISKLASSLWASMTDLDKLEWVLKGAAAKEALARQKAEHPELCTRKARKRGTKRLAKSRLRADSKPASTRRRTRSVVAKQVRALFHRHYALLTVDSTSGYSRMQHPRLERECDRDRGTGAIVSPLVCSRFRIRS